MMTLSRLLVLLVFATSIGCVSEPRKRIFVLNRPAEPVPGITSEDGKATIELTHVDVPDYLDTTDLMLRGGQNELQPSSAGGWGERLSIGMTHALGSALTKRLPGTLVTLSTPSGQQPAQKILIDVEAFDIWPDGRCVLTARWTILGPARQAEASQRGTFVATAQRSASQDLDIAAIVAATADVIDRLADSIAATAKRTPARIVRMPPRDS